MARKTRWSLTTAIILFSVGGYFALPGDALKDDAYSVIGVASVVAILAGVRLHRPADRTAWMALAASSICFVVGDVVTNFYDELGWAVPVPSVADVLYLAGYPFLFVAVARLSSPATAGASRENRVDGAIVSIGVLAVTWQLLMGSYAHDSTVGVVGRLVTLAYPVMDIGVVFIVVNAVVFATVRRPVDTLVGAALTCMLVADFGYDLLVQRGTYDTGNPIDAGWLISYILLGVAALHPSMGLVPTTPVAGRASRGRFPLVALAGFVAPGILLVAGLTGRTADVPFLAGSSMVLFGLIVLRVVWLLNRVGYQAEQLHVQADSLQLALDAQLILEEDLRHQAFHDGLTGLPNRALLHDRVGHALEASTRTAARVAVLFCDLDNFKAVNDSLGHDVGDQLLLAASIRLVAAVRPGDTVARLGGDEFAILMDSIEDVTHGTAVAERAVSALRQPFVVGGQIINVSVSIGIAYAEAGVNTQVLLSQADAAMYEAKSAGKDRAQEFETIMRTRIVHRMQLRSAFPDALRREEFQLVYQPQISLRDESLQGFEALVRWTHPVHGEIAPADFVSLAEETGFIIPLGRWILETACSAAAGWPDVHAAPLTVAVNVSGRQLENEQLMDDVRTALSYSGLHARQLTLEITESVLVVNPALNAEILKILRGLGVPLAIDDFGTGYSSLSSLRQFPVDSLKIDRSFVESLTESDNATSAFVQAIIRLAHDVGLSTVAEGIEFPVQQQRLAEMGCDSMQGFLLAPPMPASAVEAFIATFPGRSADAQGVKRREVRPPAA